MKPLVRIIFPDNLENPVGGLSIVGSKIKKYLSDEFDLEFVGHPQKNKMDGYIDTPFRLNIPHGALNTITAQSVYFANSVKGRKPDIIHAFDWSVFLAGVHAAEHYDIPLIASMQLSINELNSAGISYTTDIKTSDGYWINETHKHIELMGLHNARKVIHVSNAYASKFPQFKDKSVTIQNGVDIDEFSNGEKIKLPGENKLKVVYIGRYAYMKNIGAIVNAKIPDNIDLIYVGKESGGEGQPFKDMLNHVQNNANVHYIGPAFGKEKSDILTSADAVIFPSRHEPFGIVGLEAMATKSVLLTSRANGISDYANDSNSIYCGYDSQTLSLALLYFSEMSESRKEELINNGFDTAKAFSWEKSTDKYKEVYRECLI